MAGEFSADSPRMMASSTSRFFASTIAFRLPDDAFVARLEDGDLSITRGTTEAADAILVGDTMALRRTIYGKRGFGGDGLHVEGDRDAAQAFVDLFALPPKIEQAAVE